MKVGALVLGILGGLFSLGLGLLGYVFGGLADLAGAGGGSGMKFVSIALPVIALLGAGVVLTKPMIGSGLLAFAAIGLVAILGFNFATLIPVVLLILGAVLAFFSTDKEGKGETSPTGIAPHATVEEETARPAPAAVPQEEASATGDKKAPQPVSLANDKSPAEPYVMDDGARALNPDGGAIVPVSISQADRQDVQTLEFPREQSTLRQSSSKNLWIGLGIGAIATAIVAFVAFSYFQNQRELERVQAETRVQEERARLQQQEIERIRVERQLQEAQAKLRERELEQLRAERRAQEQQAARLQQSSQTTGKLQRLLNDESGVWTGIASNSQGQWPLRIRVVAFDNKSGTFAGELELPSLNALHRLEGRLVGEKLMFTAVEYIRQGSSVACTYELELQGERRLVGTYGRCRGGGAAGRAEVVLQKTKEHSTVLPQPRYDTPGTPTEVSIDLNGSWEGNYSYAGRGGAVPFNMETKASGSNFEGTIVEPNTFGNQSAKFLRANLSGSVHGNRVRFVKTYDGTGGQTHSVSYEGTYDAKTKHIVGRWSIGSSTGDFSVTKR